MNNTTVFRKSVHRKHNQMHARCARIVEAARDGQIPLEEAADALLDAVGLLGKKFGTYTQTQLNRKIRMEDRRIPTIDKISVPAEMADYLSETLVDEMIEIAGLSAMQEICYRFHASGLSVRQISASLRIRRQVIAAYLGAARRKVLEVANDGKHAGWYEVYLSEVNRYIYRPRRFGNR